MTAWMNSCFLSVSVTRKEQSFPVSMAVSSLPLAALLLQQDAFLHPDERNHLTGISQHQYLLGRHAAKLAASHYTQSSPNTIRIRPGVFGQPVLDCPGHNNVQVSIAHSGHSAIAVVFPEWHPMAVDIEDVNGGRLLLPPAPKEAALTASLPYAAIERSLLLWSAKEALSKVLKTGITTDLELYEVATVHMEGDFLVSTFIHFVQYKAISWIAGNMVCSLVLPQRSQPDLTALKTLTSPAS